MRTTTLKRHEVQVLLRAGHKQKDVANFAGLSVRTVQRIAREPLISGLAEPTGPLIGRPSKVEAFRERVEQWLRGEPALRAAEVLVRARAEGYTGGKTALYSLVTALRHPEALDSMTGAFSEHDAGDVRVAFRDGTEKRLPLLASRLRFSRWMEASLIPNLNVESIFRNLLLHFEAWGGVPLVAVFRNPNAAVWASDPRALPFSAAVSEMAMRLGFGLELDAEHTFLQRDASRGRLMSTVRRTLTERGPFRDVADVHAKLQESIREMNQTKVSRITGAAPLFLYKQEQSRLRPLKDIPRNIPFRVPVWVRNNASVLFEGKVLFMPSEAANTHAVLNLYPDRLQLVAGTTEVWHPWPPNNNHARE